MRNKSILLCMILLSVISCGKPSGGGDNSNLGFGEDYTSLSMPSFKNHADYNVFKTKGIIYAEEDSRYFNVSVIRDPSITNLNYQNHTKGLRKIVINGKKIIIEKNHASGIYELIWKTTDVAELTINAEEVIIKSGIHLAGADITINSKILEFKNYSSIDTTPVTKSQSPGFKADGADGLNAGAINLNVETIKMDDSNNVILIADGGYGQQAGPGKSGGRGTNPHLIKGYYSYQTESCTHERGGRHERKRVMGWHCSWGRKKTGKRAGNGHNAVVGGKPGEPGQAGNIVISFQGHIKTSQKGGRAGAMDRKRFGGQPGKPAKTCAHKSGQRSKDETYSCVTAVKGANVEPKKSRILAAGKKYISKVKSEWLTDALISSKYIYAKDLFMANERELAMAEIFELEEMLIKKNYKSLLSMKIMNKLNNLKSKYDLNLDYYGHTLNWVPNLGFEVSNSLFKTEVKRSIRILYLVRIFKSKMTTNLQKQEALSAIQEELFSNINKNRNRVTALVDRVVITEEVKDEYKAAEEEFKFALVKLEEKIKEMAENNLEVPFMKKAISTIAALSRSIPIADPTFKLLGNGLEYAYNLSDGSKTAVELLEDLPTLMDTYEAFDWKKANTDLSTKLRSMDPSELSKARNMKEKIEYVATVSDFVKPIYTQTTKQMNQVSRSSIAKSDLDREMNKIKSSHKMYQEVIRKLQALHIKQEAVLKQLQSFEYMISGLLDSIVENYSTIASSFDDIFNSQKIKKQEFDLVLDTVSSREEDYINYYYYLLTKSFQYRFLAENKTTFDIAKTYEKMEAFILTNGNSVEEAINLLSVAYETEISSFTREIIETYVSGSNTSEQTKEYFLSNDEMDALNLGKEIYIDMTGDDFFGTAKDDLRLISIHYNDTFEIISEDENNSEIEIETSHLGKSILTKENQTYLFDHGNTKKQSNLNWKTYINLEDQFMSTSKPSVSDQSLLSNLLKLEKNTDFFVRPGARTYLKVKLNKGLNTKISRLALIIKYSYTN